MEPPAQQAQDSQQVEFWLHPHFEQEFYRVMNRRYPNLHPVPVEILWMLIERACWAGWADTIGG